ncbi:DUF6551 family protein [Oscillibacter sp.]|uniref:DUF6551 family protein n=1 Tax=Oscillibacter sp. TaxID=1945593 RepID=UPI002899BC67|nr:DUF6551 family protein [Oscillibacter sp.]
MTKNTTDFEYKQLSTKEIIVNPSAQRDVNKRDAQFRKIMKEFDPRLVNDISVAQINGKYYCFNGQMTMKVLKARNRNNDLLVRCKVFHGMTELDTAEMFVKQNGTTSQVSAMDKLRVEFNYGNRAVVDFVRLTEMNGVVIDWTKSAGKNKIVAVSTAFQIFNDFNDPREYSEFLHILREAWGGDSWSFRHEIMSGLYLFMKAYREQYKSKTLVSKLSRVSPKTIIREAKISTASGDRKYAIQILNAYNFNASINRLPDLL